MSLQDLLTMDSGAEQETDSLGVGGSGPWDSNIYDDLTIEMAYLDESKGGALSLNLNLINPDGNKLRATFWMTSGKAKGRKNTYERQGKTYPMPGFSMANALSELTLGVSIGKACESVEVKQVERWDRESSKAIPQKTQVVMDLLNQVVTAGVLKQEVEKSTLQGDKYVETGELREENEISAFFDNDTKHTRVEKAAKTEAIFHETWKETWAGKVKDKTTKAGRDLRAKGITGEDSSGAAGAGGAVSSDVDDLFPE